MALESRLELRLSQKLILTPQLQQAIKLLQMPHLELSEFLTQELLENPLLEESQDEGTDEGNDEEPVRDESSPGEDGVVEDAELPLESLMHLASDEYFDERSSDGRDLGYFTPGTVTPPSFEQFLTREPELADHLLWQLRFSNEAEVTKEICEGIIGNINENGYLTSTLEEIAEAARSNTEETERALGIIHGFDPPGVGARNPVECLYLQIKALNLQGTIVEKIVLNHIDDLERKRYQAIAQQENVSVEDVMTAVKIIGKLEPKPGRNFARPDTHYIIPDVYLVKTDDGYQIILNDEGIPRLRVSSFYRRLIHQNNACPKEDKQFLIEKLRSAVGLLKSLDQRNRTIYRVTETLLDLQHDFFDHGVEGLNPLTLKDVAASLNLHESTVSRVTSNKYLSCEHGIFGFRFLFSSALSSGEGSVSSTSVKSTIRRIVTEEDPRKPYSDQSIADILKKDGVTIARRTVAKYREELAIPSQVQRKKRNQ